MMEQPKMSICKDIRLKKDNSSRDYNRTCHYYQLIFIILFKPSFAQLIVFLLSILSIDAFISYRMSISSAVIIFVKIIFLYSCFTRNQQLSIPLYYGLYGAQKIVQISNSAQTGVTTLDLWTCRLSRNKTSLPLGYSVLNCLRYSMQSSFLMDLF